MDALYLEFINSEFRDFRGRWTRDDLQQPGWLEQFLSRWHLQPDVSLPAAPIDQLIELRALLRSAIEDLTAGQITEHKLTALNNYLHGASLNRHLITNEKSFSLEMHPLQRNWSWVQEEIVASFAQSLVEHDPDRLKICANTHCRWIFYDESKSGTRRYCTPDKCANLLKVRRFRARHRSPSGQ